MLCNSWQDRSHHVWLYREARSTGQLKADLVKLRKTLYIYDGKLPPCRSEGIDLRFWNVKDCVLWKTLLLQFDVARLKGIKRVDNHYRFYYRLEASIDGLSVVFHARARPDGLWIDDNLTLTATCSTQVDAALHGVARNLSPVTGHSEEGEKLRGHAESHHARKKKTRRRIAYSTEKDTYMPFPQRCIGEANWNWRLGRWIWRGNSLTRDKTVIGQCLLSLARRQQESTVRRQYKYCLRALHSLQLYIRRVFPLRRSYF